MELSTRPSLAVLIPNYNHGRYLRAAIEAVFNQSRPPDEVVVLDDASTDDSASILDELARQHPSLRVSRNTTNRGVVAGLNTLLGMTSCDYVHLGAADDEVLPGFYEASMAILKRYPQAGLSSTMVRVVDAEGVPTAVIPVAPVLPAPGYLAPDVSRRLIVSGRTWLVGSGCVYRRDAVTAEGGLQSELGAYCDGFLQTVLTLKHGSCFVPEVLAEWRVTHTGYAASSVSSPRVAMQMWSAAARLMRTRYRDLFPPAYVDRWEAGKHLHAHLSALNRLRSQQEAVTRDLLDQLGIPAVWPLLSAVYGAAMVPTVAVALLRRWPLVLPLLVTPLRARLSARGAQLRNT